MTATMKAMIYTQYGSPDVIQFKEVEKPTPKDNEVLIKVHAASVNAGDLHYLRGMPWLFRLAAGLLKPKNIFLGADVAGRVEAVGKNVTQFQLGDEVFGDLSACGRGSLAEYVCASETAVVLKPADLSFEEAAAIPVAAVTALHGLQSRVQIQPGQKVLINGASGGVGTFAVQIAKVFGAEVTAVCSTRNLDRMRSIGADHVIDYTQEDFTRNGEIYDVIIDTVFGQASFDRCKQALQPKGLYVPVAGGPKEMMQMLWTSLRGGKKVIAGPVSESKDDLVFLSELAEAGKLSVVIDRCYPLEQIAEAHRYVETGRKRGSVVITVA